MSIRCICKFLLLLLLLDGVHAVPRECKIKFDIKEKNDRCLPPEAYNSVADNQIECGGICFVGYKDEGKTVSISFKTEDGKLLLVEHGNFTPKITRLNVSVPEDYTVENSNLYNGVIQVTLKTVDKIILAFIGITKSNYPIETWTIGPWFLSGVLLRDEDSVIAVIVKNNRICQANISMNSKAEWIPISDTLNGTIEFIKINNNYVQGIAGKPFEIPLSLDTKLTINETRTEVLNARVPPAITVLLFILFLLCIVMCCVKFLPRCRLFNRKHERISSSCSIDIERGNTDCSNGQSDSNQGPVPPNGIQVNRQSQADAFSC